MNLEPDYKRTFRKVQYIPNGGTLTLFIGAEVVEPLLDDGAGLIEFETKIVQVRILLEFVGYEDNPKTGHPWYDLVKGSVEYVIRNGVPLVCVWDIFFGM